METSSGIQASLPGRYAAALFELAREAGSLSAVETSLATLKAALSESHELRALAKSPLIARGAKSAAVTALAATLRLDPLTTRFLGVLASNRRLNVLGEVLRAFGEQLAAHRGEARAEVTSAFPLSTGQLAALGAQLKSRVGRDVALDTAVDPQLLGGLVVRIGSQMIDNSIRNRLNTLATAMKG